MRVKNINGTSQTVCNCGSWLQHWRNFSNQQATICRALGCGRNDLVGAHVQKDVSYDNYKDKVIDLLRRVCTVSVETMKIIREIEQSLETRVSRKVCHQRY